LNRVTVCPVEHTKETNPRERSETMTAAYGMMAMMPVLFASAGYVLVSSQGSDEHKRYGSDD
jgi:hypothetical protein